jgi:HEAT repeat protein
LPEPDNPLALRSAAIFVIFNLPQSPMILKLLPLLKSSNTHGRIQILSVVLNRIGPTDADQIPFLLTAGNDPSFTVRGEVMVCLSRIGPSATNAVPTVLKLCSDTDIDVRMDAAWALWKITGETNPVVPVLESALRQNPLSHRRRLAAQYLSEMGQLDPSLIPQ